MEDIGVPSELMEHALGLTKHRALPLAFALLLLSVGMSCMARDSGQPLPSAAAPGGGGAIILATTTSTQDSGLLDVLVPIFEREAGYQVKTVAVGSGAALALAGRGEADVVLVHAPLAEEQWMATELSGASSCTTTSCCWARPPTQQTSKLRIQ
jgi:ABC-type proline/glycine betaine transport system substrate-binding protein